MISDEASRCLTILSALGAGNDPDWQQPWPQVVTRIVMDLDEAGNGAALQNIAGILSEAWEASRARLTPQQEYEAACVRYNKAVERWPRAKEEAGKIMRDIEAEYEEARRHLASFQSSPGIPRPEYRLTDTMQYLAGQP